MGIKVINFFVYLLFSFYLTYVLGSVLRLLRDFNFYSMVIVSIEIILSLLVVSYALFNKRYRSKILVMMFVSLVLVYAYGILVNIEMYFAVYGYLGLIYQVPTFYLFFKVSVAPHLRKDVF